LSENAKDVSALKAVSQNLMHTNLSITDGVYGILAESDVKKQITNLSHEVSNSEITDELINPTKRLLLKLEGRCK
jgi:hypothetical protein